MAVKSGRQIHIELVVVLIIATECRNAVFEEDIAQEVSALLILPNADEVFKVGNSDFSF